MKINWFSPLPPAKTEIGNYTQKILPYLQEKLDITLWTNQSQWNQDLEKYTVVKQYTLEKLPVFELNQGDINIYNLGNNASFHDSIWYISRQFPGIVILHDEKMQDFFYMLSEDKNNYIEYMKNIYGKEGEKNARLFLHGYKSMEFMTENYPLTSLALENALGVITHNQNTYSTLAKSNQWITGYTPLPYISNNSTPVTSLKTASIPYKLIIFGFIGKNRRLTSILEALSQFKHKNSFSLDIYGELWDENYIQTQIQTLNLENLVTIHGFVSDDELDNALTQADLALNLRYPTMGEASGSQLRLWSHGLPSLVTNIGWYSSLNPSTVAFVRHDHEIEDIQRHLQDFLAHPQKYQNMGKIGKEILETNHTPSLYAEAIVDFVTQVCKYRTHSSLDRMVKRVAMELNYLSPNVKSKHNLRHVSEIIKFIVS